MASRKRTLAAAALLGWARPVARMGGVPSASAGLGVGMITKAIARKAKGG